MKKVIVLIITLISINCFSQVNGKIYFKDGNVFEGAIKKKSTFFGSMIETKIVFQPEEGKIVEKGSFDIEKVELISHNDSKVTNVFFFKKFNNQQIFMERIASNKEYDVFVGSNTVGISTLVPGFTTTTTDFKIYEEYFISSKNSSKLEKFHKRVSSKNIKALLSKYSSKCNKVDDIVSKYKKNKKLKKRDLFKELGTVCN